MTLQLVITSRKLVHSMRQDHTDARLKRAICRTTILAALLCRLVSQVGLPPKLAAAEQDDSSERLRLNRPRVIVETDAGADPDDEQSLVRFLVYANEFDIVAIIANRATARNGENLNTERTGLGITKQLIGAYGQCYPKLKQHDDRYPSPTFLFERTVASYTDMESAVQMLNQAIDAPDPRPLWFMNWGTDDECADSVLKVALDRVLKERGPEEYAKFKSRIRLSSTDRFGEHTYRIAPAFPLWVDTFRPEVDRRRWYHRFSALTAKAGGMDIQRDVLTGHGPLGALYPLNTTHPQKEGDTMTFLYLMNTGMNSPDEPQWGSWAGRYGRDPAFPDKPYYLANQTDNWNGSAHRDNTLARWAADLQNDFRARMDWCVRDRNEANHPPRVKVAGNSRQTVAPGKTVQLDARDSVDPDGNRLSFEWWIYRELSTQPLSVELGNANNHVASLTVPPDAPNGTAHVILTVRDNGTPQLTRYARFVVEIRR